MEKTARPRTAHRQKRGFLLGSLSVGHGVSHLYEQSFPIFMPAITSTMGLSTLQVASVLGLRQAGFGLINIGAGPMVDMMKRHWGLILTGCAVMAAVNFAVIGRSPNYPVLVVAVLFVSVPGAMWHLPAAAALSQRFQERRGFAISIHGFGSNVGNIVGPVIAGALLGAIFWRHAMVIYVGPLLLVAIFVWWALKDMGRDAGPAAERRRIGEYFQGIGTLLKNPVVFGLILVSTLRGIGLNAIFHWTPFYLEEELGMGHVRAGLYYALLSGAGVVSAPLLGALSDKLGRKTILVPGMTLAAALSLLVGSAGDGLLLGLVFAGMGLFSFALFNVLQASLLDVVGRGREATATGLQFGLFGAVGAAAPLLASVIIDHLGGFKAIYYYSGILTAAAALVLIVLPGRPRETLPDGS